MPLLAMVRNPQPPVEGGWLLQSAPLSLRKYTGPVNSRDQLAVEQRYSTIDNCDSPVIKLIPEPLDNMEWM